MKIHRLVLGSEIEKYSDKELEQIVEEANVFARVTPEHKLRIIQALQRNGHTVGFMGDGVNDVPSLHNADVGISVNTAIDVAKEAAQIVLLRRGLDVIVGGITEGRRTFMNTIKYILMGTGSNFGEMVSTAGASFFLPFLPMSPAQILVENGLYDVSQLPIASDNVDEENLIKPKHWDIKMIYKFMLIFGTLSAVWMIGTFLFLRFSLHANTALFQTVAFLVSITTEMVVVMIVRTTRVPFWRSRPSKWLAISCLAILILAFWLPYSPLARSLNFTTSPLKALIFLAVASPVYAVAVELTKAKFFKLSNL
jgi:Mg2+-importing ATPase